MEKLGLNTHYLDLTALEDISNGDASKALKYLVMFNELIPQRIESLKIALSQDDRKMIRQTLHSMSPQLVFFGIPDISLPIQRMELEYESLPAYELNEIIDTILSKLGKALIEVDHIINTNFK